MDVDLDIVGLDPKDYDAEPDDATNEQPVEGGGDKTKKKKEPHQAEVLVKLAAGAALWHHGDTAYACVRNCRRYDNLRIRTRAFRLWLGSRFYLSRKRPPHRDALEQAIDILTYECIANGPEETPHVRVAKCGGTAFVDLANESGQVVAIGPGRRDIVENPPVRFIRPRGLLPLPMPAERGDIGLLRRFVNVTDDDWPLLLSDLIASLSPHGPYPVLGLHGEHGSAKSTACKVIRELIDPNVAGLRSLPRDERDLVIAAQNSWMLCYDNVSTLNWWQSDAFCRISTGGGFGTRELYSDDEEKLFSSTRPIMLNGITVAATRPDLLDRSIVINLPRIEDKDRRDEAAFWAEFYEVRPIILAGLYSAMSVALANLPNVRLERMPRMADFARLVVAAEPALGLRPGEFLHTYTRNRREGVIAGIEHSAIGPALLDLMGGLVEWRGTATQLLGALRDPAGESATKSPYWPKSSNTLGNELRRLVPSLRATGLDVAFGRKSDRGRSKIITLTRRTLERACETSSEPSGSSTNSDSDAEAGLSPGDFGRRVDDGERPLSEASSDEKGVPEAENAAVDHADDLDDVLPRCSEIQGINDGTGDGWGDDGELFDDGSEPTAWAKR